MPSVSLSVCLSKNAMTAAIRSGSVVPEGVEWTVSAVHPSEMFWRQLKFAEFDISEMSMSSLSIAVSNGVRDWVGIPVFTTRRFFHTRVMVREGAAIEKPADLVGKRVGVPEYQQTAAVWSRGALLHEFGVPPEQFQWFMERPPARSHGGATGFTPPEGVELSYIPTDTTMGQMLAAGELDAALVYISDRNLVDRSRQGAMAVPGLRPLFPDPIAEGIRYYAKTGILPINHCVVIRKELLEKHPWLALNIYSAFLDAKDASGELARSLLDPWQRIGTLSSADAERIWATDPLPYGVQCQIPVFETLADYLVEQGLVSEKVTYDRVFAESTLDV